MRGLRRYRVSTGRVLSRIVGCERGVPKVLGINLVRAVVGVEPADRAVATLGLTFRSVEYPVPDVVKGLRTML